MGEYVITFKRANHAVMAEQLLLDSGLLPSVMPVVPQIAAGCGIALRIKPEELSRCRQILAQSSVEIAAVYERRAAEHGFDYLKTDI